MSLEIVAALNGETYSWQIKDFNVVPYEGREGVAQILEATGQLVNAKNPKDSVRFTGFMAVYIYNDGSYAAEYGIYNDVIKSPPGTVTLTWGVLFNGNTIHLAHDVKLCDQTGDTAQFGELKYAPRLDYKPLFWMADKLAYKVAPPKPTDHADPVGWTHTTGSPRNEFFNVNMSMFMQDQNKVWIDDLSKFTLFQSKRPNHLSDSKGNVFDYAKISEYASTKPVFYDGKIVVQQPGKIPTQTYGRTLDFKFTEVPKHPLNGETITGGDLEHMTVDKLYHHYMATGSRLARRELLQCCNWMPCTWEFGNDDAKHPISERVVGWVAKAWALGADVLGGVKYFEMIEKLIRQTMRYAVVDQSAQITYILGSTKGKQDHIPDQKFACVWQTAIAIHGLATYIRMAEKYAKNSTMEFGNAKKLIAAGMLGNVKFGYKEGKGFVNDYGIEWIANEPNAAPDWLGTQEWVVGAMAEAIKYGDLTPELKQSVINVANESWKFFTSKSPEHSTPPFNKWPERYLKSFLLVEKEIILPSVSQNHPFPS